MPTINEADHVYLSPHLDDAVLSCGGLIYRQARAGERVAVVTIFAGDPPRGAALSNFARELHARWQAANPAAARREEDVQALTALHPGVVAHHLPLPECLYRRDPATGSALYASEEALFGEVHPDDPALLALQTPLAIPPGACLYAPLGVGHHVDHQIVRRAVAAWGVEAHYYEEYPYTVGEHQGGVSRSGGERAVPEPPSGPSGHLPPCKGEGRDRGSTHNITALRPEPGAESHPEAAPPGWRRETMPPDPDALAAKRRAIACYASQISTFWESLEAMACAIAAYEERVWHPPSKDR